MVLGNTLPKRGGIISFLAEAEKRGRHVLPRDNDDPSVPLRELALVNKLHKGDIPQLNKLHDDLRGKIEISVNGYGVDDFLPFTDLPEDLQARYDELLWKVILERMRQVAPR